MRYREFWVVLVFAGVMTAGGLAFGDDFRLGFLAVLGVVGLVMARWYARLKRRIGESLAASSEEAQERALVLLENAALRPEIVEQLDRRAPPVPLRGGRELYGYPAEVVRTGRWTMNACLLLAGFAAASWATDVVAGTEHFVGRDTPWWDPAALIALFGLLGFAVRWCVRAGEARLEVTEEAMVLYLPNRAPRRIAWSAITEVRRSELGRSLSVRAPGARITVWDTLDGFGRLVNVVATRLPAGARWRAG